jgi:PAS domain S-box-containing protein
MNRNNKNNTSVIERVSSFTSALTGLKTKNEIIDSALKLLSELFGSRRISFFMLDKNSFEFNYLTSLNNDEGDVRLVFDEATERGIVASALNDAELKLFDYPPASVEKKSVYLLPLIALDGIVGMIMIISPDACIDPAICPVFMMFSKILAFTLDSKTTAIDIESEREKNEQMVSGKLSEFAQGIKDLKNILDHVQVGIMLINVTSLRIVDVNQPASDMIGVPISELIGLDRNEYLFSAIPGMGTLGVYKNYECFLKRSNGTIIPILRNSIRVEINGEEFFLESFIDISERKKLEDELHKSHFELEKRVEARTIMLKDTNELLLDEITKRKKTEEELLIARDKAEESDKIKSALLANMSHEFRTPLISILGFSEILENELKETGQKEMVDNIYLSGFRLLNTLDGVLKLSQLNTNTYPVNLVETDIIPIVKDLAQKYETKAHQKGLVLNRCFESSAVRLSVDPVLISEAISNLLENGIKFTEKGKIDFSVSCGVGTTCRIVIQDTGIGIGPADLDLVFKEFRQTSEGYKRNYEGCGLGLTLARKMVEAMNGSLEVQSETGIGSSFVISIPINL